MNIKKIQLGLLTFGLFILAFNFFELITKARTDSPVVFVECIAGIILIYLPQLCRRFLRIEIPDMIVIFYWFFLLISVFLGTCLHLIAYISWWDKLLHSISPMVLTALGYGIAAIALKKAQSKDVSPWLFLLFGFAFAGVCGVFWEFWEFLCDTIGDMNLQRYRAGGVDLIGRAALMDTMGDLLTNTIGAVLMGIFAFTQSKGDASYFENYCITIIPKKNK